MSEFFLPLLVMLLVLAALLREDFVFTLLYLCIGAYVLGRWWSRKALASVKSQRILTDRAFLEDEIPVQLEIVNKGVLPVLWMRVHDTLPVDLSTPNFFRSVVSLGPREQVQLEYRLKARKRGYYRIGPLSVYSGDIFGLADPVRFEGPSDYLVVYPMIIPLAKVKIPSQSPMGTLRHKQPIFEDPTRVFAKREYVNGDSTRRIDWKTTAALGRLQVKKFESSIALETAIFLDLNPAEYEQRFRFHSTELAIVVAASLASWVVSKKQTVGLITNGYDPLTTNGVPQVLPPRKGRGHLMRVLDVLARIQTGETDSLLDLLHRESQHLAWGTSLIVIGGSAPENLFDQLFQSRRAGQNAMIVLCGPVAGYREIERRATQFDFPIYHLLNEHDLNIWK